MSRFRARRGASAILAVMPLGFGLPGTAHAASSGTETVDVQLVLAVDVSLSMSPDELEIQRHGYAAALADDRVIGAILDGAHARIAVAYVEWAGEKTQRVVVSWTTIASRADAEAFARKLTDEVPQSARRTSISGGLLFSADLIAESGIRADKKVIDVSGDGPNNQGEPVEGARAKVMAQGITINGLPLMTSGGFSSAFDMPDLDKYYAHCVIGGPGAFMVPVNDWSQFPEAVRRKLELELAGPDLPERLDPPVIRVTEPAPYDCLVGEKMWGGRFRDYGK